MTLRRQSMVLRGMVNLVLMLASSICSAEQSASTKQQITTADSANSAILATVEATLNRAVSNHTLSGVSLLLVQDGKVLFKKAYGDLSVDDQIRIASSTKPLATVGVLILVDEGKLSLDDTIGSLLPEFRGTQVEKATLRQLLSHQAGIGGEYPGGRPTEGTLAEFSRLIAKRGSLGSPGDFSYSGVSIDIACRMAEVAAGVPIEEHLKSRVWLPLNMTHSDFDMAADPKSVSSAQRDRGEGRYVSCGGGMESTLDDMANFYEMLLHRGVYQDKRLISEELYAEMISKQGKNPIKIPYISGEYGLGLYRDRVAADGTPGTISHGGALGTMPWADLDSGLVGVFFSQSRLRKVLPLIAEIQAEVRGKELTATATPADSSRRSTSQGQRSSGRSSSVSQRAPERSFNRISGGAEVINLKQLQDFIENEASNSRLKGQPERVEQLFKQLDQNSDGVLILEEYSKVQSLRR